MIRRHYEIQTVQPKGYKGRTYSGHVTMHVLADNVLEAIRLVLAESAGVDIKGVQHRGQIDLIQGEPVSAET